MARQNEQGHSTKGFGRRSRMLGLLHIHGGFRCSLCRCAPFFPSFAVRTLYVAPKFCNPKTATAAIRVRAMYARSQHMLPPPSPVRPSPCSGNNFWHVKVVFVVRTVVICAHRAARRTARGRMKVARLPFFTYCARYKSTRCVTVILLCGGTTYM